MFWKENPFHGSGSSAFGNKEQANWINSRHLIRIEQLRFFLATRKWDAFVLSDISCSRDIYVDSFFSGVRDIIVQSLAQSKKCTCLGRYKGNYQGLLPDRHYNTKVKRTHISRFKNNAKKLSSLNCVEIPRTLGHSQYWGGDGGGGWSVS